MKVKAHRWGSVFRRKSSGNEEDKIVGPSCCAGPNRLMQAKVLRDPLCDLLDCLFPGQRFFLEGTGPLTVDPNDVALACTGAVAFVVERFPDFCEQGASPVAGQGVPVTSWTSAGVAGGLFLRVGGSSFRAAGAGGSRPAWPVLNLFGWSF